MKVIKYFANIYFSDHANFKTYSLSVCEADTKKDLDKCVNECEKSRKGYEYYAVDTGVMVECECGGIKKLWIKM